MTNRDRSRDELAGIGLPDPTMELWRAETVATEAGPRAGLPVPAQDTLLALSASGPQSAPIEVATARGGLPTRDASGAVREVTQAAGVIWRPVGGEWRGWDPPRTISRWDSLLYSTTATDTTIHPDVVVLSSGVVLTCFERRVTTGSTWRVSIRRKTPEGVYSTVDVEVLNEDPGQPFLPCMVVLPNGRVHLYRYLRRGGYGMLRWFYSDDDGLTWLHGGDGAVDNRLDDIDGAAPTRMRVAYSRGQMLLCARNVNASGGNVGIKQYASSDLGHHFQRVHIALVTDTGRSAVGPSFDIAPSFAGGFVVYTLGYGQGAAPVTTLTAHRLPDAYRPISECLTEVVAFLRNQVVAATDESGIITVLSKASDSNDHQAFASFNGGVSHEPYYLNTAAGSSGATVYPERTNAVLDSALAVGRGRGHLAFRWGDMSVTQGFRLGMVYFGGWVSPTMATVRQSESALDSVGWWRTYLPIDVPQEYADITAAGTGIEYLTTTDNVVVQTVTMTNQRRYTQTVSLPLALRANPVHLQRWVGQVVSGPAVTSSGAWTLRGIVSLTSAGSRIQYDIRVSATQFAIYNSAGTLIGAAQNIPSEPVEIEVEGRFITATNLQIRTWWRPRGTGEDRPMQPGPTGNIALTAISGNTLFILGNHANASIVANTYEWSRSIATAIGSAARSDSPAPDSLAPALLAGRPYLGQGVYLKAAQGPTWRGESWTIEPAPDFGLQKAVEEPSPRAAWRSTSVNTPQSIAIRWQDKRGPILAIALRGSTVPQLGIEYWDGAAWIAYGTAVLSSSLPFIRTGNTLRPGPGTAGDQAGYLAHGETVGGYVSLEPPAILNPSPGRRIVHQSEGLWRDGDPLQARIVLEPNVVSGPASGNARLVWPDAVILVDLEGIETTAIRLNVPTPDPSPDAPDPFWTIGTIACRWLWPVGSEYAWGEVSSIEAHIEGGRTRDQLWRGTVVAPPSRRVEMQYAVVDESGLQSSVPYVQAGSARVAEAGTARALRAFLRELNGPAGSLLYLPRMPRDILGPVTVLLGRERFILGRLADATHGITGLEGSTFEAPVVDAGTLAIEEDV